MTPENRELTEAQHSCAASTLGEKSRQGNRGTQWRGESILSCSVSLQSCLLGIYRCRNMSKCWPVWDHVHAAEPGLPP